MKDVTEGNSKNVLAVAARSDKLIGFKKKNDENKKFEICDFFLELCSM